MRALRLDARGIQKLAAHVELDQRMPVEHDRRLMAATASALGEVLQWG